MNNNNSVGFGISKNDATGWAKTCESCHSAPGVVYCRADEAYLCADCDSKVHAANHFASRHERVWVCEACEGAPAELTCHADAAALCSSCDAEIHSANSLASRHHRVPILPLPAGCLPCASGVSKPFLGTDNELREQPDENEASSWFLSETVDDNQIYNGVLFGEEVDEYLDLAEYNSFNDQEQQQQQPSQQQQNHREKNDVTELVVPSHSVTLDEQEQQLLQQHQQQEQGSYGFMNMEYQQVLSNTGFNYVHPLCYNVSLISTNPSTEPNPITSVTDIPSSYFTVSKQSIDLLLGPSVQLMPQFIQADREAKVLRYRERKKMRKFQKTVRYATRKAYAETRPRIKGRFAKKSDLELDVDKMFSSSVLSESSCGIVPSF